MQINLNYAAVKAVSKFIVGVGASTIVHRTVQNNVPARNLVEFIPIKAATYAMSLAATETMQKYTESKMDEAAARIIAAQSPDDPPQSFYSNRR